MNDLEVYSGLRYLNRIKKRIFDFTLSLIGLLLVWPVIIIAWLLATFSTGRNGFYMQTRVGRHGKLFKIVKIRTMKTIETINTTVTTSKDPRITRTGKIFRQFKIDELPQLINVLFGQMSFVGPRPDVPGFADSLTGNDRLMLEIRPGITGPATLKYRNEEEILSTKENPDKYNAEVIFPDKVKINLDYIKNYSLLMDIKYIFKTILS